MKLEDSVVTADGVGVIKYILKNGYLIKTKIGRRYSHFKFYEPKEVKKA